MFPRRPYPKKNRGPRANEQIRAAEIRLIGPNGEQIGLVTPQEGLEKAREAGLDLVEISGQVNPPVCKILDLGKHLYEQEKKERASRKKQKVVEVKEIKMSPKIEEHDYQTKLRNARRFLERGDKVKFRMFFRGREITHAERGKEVVKRFVEDLDDIAEIERDEGLQGNMIHVHFSPLKPSVKKAKKEAREAQEAKAAAEAKENEVQVEDK